MPKMHEIIFGFITNYSQLAGEIVSDKCSLIEKICSDCLAFDLPDFSSLALFTLPLIAVDFPYLFIGKSMFCYCSAEKFAKLINLRI